MYVYVVEVLTLLIRLSAILFGVLVLRVTAGDDEELFFRLRQKCCLRWKATFCQLWFMFVLDQVSVFSSAV